ncbi:hypothetical protein BDV18DRAFT_161547 [Aspergillus unguis]
MRNSINCNMPGTVLITGANGSLALGFAESFLELYPEYTLVATVRNPSPDKDPNTAKLARLVSRYPLAKVHIEALDLGNLAGVHSFADNLSERISSGMLPPISAIVCNAMTWSLESGQKFTSDGYEATFQVAHLAHYLLVLKLLANMDKEAGRIVMLGSATHYPEKKNPLSSLRPGIPDAKNIEELVHPTPDPEGLAHDRGFQRYGTSKLANVIFAEDLNGRLKQHPDLCNITATAMDPGGLLESRGQTGQKASVQRMKLYPNAPTMKLSSISIATAALTLPLQVAAGPLGYGVCQAGCSGVVVACYTAAGFTFGTVFAAAAPPAIIQCNAAYGACQAACAAVLLTPTP